jgi:hypothetical protein
MTVIFVYFPLSIVVLVNYLRLHLVKFEWGKIHGPFWGVIIKQQQARAAWPLWVGPVLAFTSFLFIGTTRNARAFYEQCVEWIFDHSPKKLQAMLPGFKKISESCKQNRSAKLNTGGNNFVSMVDWYFPLFKYFLIIVNRIVQEPARTGLIQMTTVMMNGQ